MKNIKFSISCYPIMRLSLSIIFPLGPRHCIHHWVFTYRTQKRLVLRLLKFDQVCACPSLYDQKYLVKANFFQSFVQSILILFTYLCWATLETLNHHSIVLHSRNHFRLDLVSQFGMRLAALFLRFALRSSFLQLCV